MPLLAELSQYEFWFAVKYVELLRFRAYTDKFCDVFFSEEAEFLRSYRQQPQQIYAVAHKVSPLRVLQALYVYGIYQQYLREVLYIGGIEGVTVPEDIMLDPWHICNVGYYRSHKPCQRSVLFMCGKSKLYAVAVEVIVSEYYLGAWHCELTNTESDIIDNAVLSALSKSLQREVTAVYGKIVLVLAA